MLEVVLALGLGVGVLGAIVEAIVQANTWEEWESELPENQDLEPHTW